MSTSTDQNPSHEYTASGTYTVALTATNRYGVSRTVKANYIAAIRAAFNVAVNSITPASSATVTGEGSYYSGDLVTLLADGQPVPGADNYADIVFVVDQSDSMDAEQRWIGGPYKSGQLVVGETYYVYSGGGIVHDGVTYTDGNTFVAVNANFTQAGGGTSYVRADYAMPERLEDALVVAGIGALTANRYALLGYAKDGVNGQRGYKFTVAGGDWGTAIDVENSATGLKLNGSTEDGYQAMDAALTGAGEITPYTFRASAAKVFILLTDEDRDINVKSGHSLTLASIQAELESYGVIVAFCVNSNCVDTGAVNCLGKLGTVAYPYQATAPYYNTSVFSNYYKPNSKAGNTIADYCTLADNLATSVWDINQLRLGGTYATGFSNAFTTILAAQIIANLSYTFDHWTMNAVDYYTNPLVFNITEPVTIDLYMT